MDRRVWLRGGCALLAGSALPGTGAAQGGAWPDRPLKLIVPIAPGGVGDLLGREFAQRLGERLGQPVVVENRPGAATMVGTVAAAKSPPDGNTLLLALTAHIQNPVHFANVGYDPIRDFTPLARIGPTATILAVRSDVPANDAREFVSVARGRGWSYGSSAPGPQVIMEIFSKSNGLELVHVPYKGEVQALADLVGGQIQTGLFSVQASRPFVREGKIRPLAVLAQGRVASLPDVKTFVEQGFDDISWTGGWYAFFVPAGVPADRVQRLTREIKAIYDDPVVHRKLQDWELILNWADGPTFAPLIQRDMELWRRLVRESGVRIEQ